jgi:hypothetical protein
MRRYNTGPFDKNKQKRKNFFSEIQPVFKSNKTIQAYINSKLSNIKDDNKNKNEIKKRKNPNNRNSTQYTINSSTSTMLSDKSNNNNNKEYYSPSISLNGEIYEKEDFINSYFTNEKIVKLIEENESLKNELKLSRNKVSNLEDILQSLIKESLPLSKEECPKPTPEIKKYDIPKKTKCQRIISYSREKYGEKIIKYVKSPEEKKRFESYFIMKKFGN